MYVESRDASGASSAVRARSIALQERELLRLLVRAAGIGWSLVFITVGLGAQLQLYADGSIFSYAIAAESGWAFHWHNISGRVLVYLYAHLPAEAYVALTQDAAGGIALYGLLFFSAPLLGLAATWRFDRTRQRRLFTVACLSTAVQCPLVFGFPTEMWIAHSLFWPALALAQCAGRGIGGSALVVLTMLALVLTHEGALVLAAAIVGAMMLNGPWSHELSRASIALLVAIVAWAGVKLMLRPDDYFSGVLARAALSFIDVTSLASPVLALTALAGGGGLGAAFLFRRLDPAGSGPAASLAVAALLGACWLSLDLPVHAEGRYPLRTVLLIATPLLGVWAVARVVRIDAASTAMAAALSRLTYRVVRAVPAQAAAGALLLISLVHVVETAKFVVAWQSYKAALRELTSHPSGDPWLGDARFVSSQRIAGDASRLSWHSTTQYLSVLLAPGLAPRRLVVHPDAGYHWITCRTAAASVDREGAIPWHSRRLVMAHACQHRRY